MATEEVGLRLSLKERRETAQGLQDTAKDIDNVGRSSSRMGSLAKRGFAALGGGLSTVAKWAGRGVLGVAAAGVGALGYALTKGFQRLTGIENATAKLTGLGHSGKRVEKIMGNALNSVRGTAFGMDEAASTAAGAVAAGVKPGRDLERTLKLVGDAATIGGSSMSEMGAIFNKVASSNKIQGDVIAQLQDQGIPIVQLLGKELGATTDQVLEMSKEGSIGFDTFRKAMERGMGGAALKSGNTTTGALKNVSAAMGRFGAGLLAGPLSLAKPLFKEIIVAVDGLTERMAPLTASLNARFGPALRGVIQGSGERFLGWVDRMTERIPQLVDQVRGFDFGDTDGTMSKIADAGGPMLDVLAGIGSSMGDVGTQIGSLIGSGIAALPPVLEAIASAMAWVTEDSTRLNTVLALIAAAFLATKAATVASSVAAAANVPIMLLNAIANMRSAKANKALAAAVAQATGAQVAQTTSTVVQTAATGKAGIATKLFAGAQKALNLVLAMNPIGLVIAAIALLVAGFVLAYKKSETFRGIIDALWNKALKPLGSFLADVFVGYLKMVANAWLSMGRWGVTAFTWLLKAAFNTFDGILSAAEKGLGWIPGIGGKIKSARAAFNEFGDGVIRKLEGVNKKLQTAQDKVNGLARDREATITIWTETKRRPGVTDAPTGMGPQPVVEREHGGPVYAGRPYIVGEKRPELFVPDRSGVILPSVPSAPAAVDYDPGDGIEMPARPIHVVLELDRRVVAQATINGVSDKMARGA